MNIQLRIFFRSWFPSHNRLISSIMDFNWNSESTADGVWLYGTGAQETEWPTNRNAGFSNENYQWLLRSDPLLSEPYESSLDWPELGPRKEALALADHSLYCRQANEMSVVPLCTHTNRARNENVWKTDLEHTLQNTNLSAHTFALTLVRDSCCDWAWPTGCALSSVTDGNVKRVALR